MAERSAPPRRARQDGTDGHATRLPQRIAARPVVRGGGQPVGGRRPRHRPIGPRPADPGGRARDRRSVHGAAQGGGSGVLDRVRTGCHPVSTVQIRRCPWSHLARPGGASPPMASLGRRTAASQPATTHRSGDGSGSDLIMSKLLQGRGRCTPACGNSFRLRGDAAAPVRRRRGLGARLASSGS